MKWVREEVGQGSTIVVNDDDDINKNAPMNVLRGVWWS